MVFRNMCERQDKRDYRDYRDQRTRQKRRLRFRLSVMAGLMIFLLLMMRLGTDGVGA